MSNVHGEPIAELSKLLTDQNYNPAVVANHCSYARGFLTYLAEREIPVATVTPSQVEQYLSHAIQCFRARAPSGWPRAGLVGSGLSGRRAG